VARQNRRRVDRVPGEARRRVLRGVSLALPAVLAVAALGGAVWATWRIGVAGELLRIGAVRFEGLARVSETELRELSPVREGDHLFLSDLEGAEAALRRHPWIASVEVRRAFPPALVVSVQERRAAALVDLGGLYLVDDRGQIFKRAAPGDGLDLPLLTGIGREDWVSRRDEVEPVLAGALALLDRWSERGLGRRAPVSEIHVDPDYGVTVYAGDDGMEVRLGTGDLPQKLERLDRVLLALDAGKQRAEVVHLDNRRRPDWVAVRLAGVVNGGRGPRGP
jgi:cell division protein FtsQ